MKKLFLLLILSACATTIPQENRTRIYDKPVGDAQRAAVQFLESNGYTIDTGAMSVGVISGEKAFSTMTAIFTGDGRFEMSFLVTEKAENRTSVTIQSKAFEKSVFGNERQVSTTGGSIQQVIDDAFAQYTAIIGGGDLGTLASINASSAKDAGRLVCNDAEADEIRITTRGSTPLYQQPNTGSAIVMHLDAGVRLSVYSRESGPFTQVCNDYSRAWVRSELLGRVR